MLNNGPVIWSGIFWGPGMTRPLPHFCEERSRTDVAPRAPTKNERRKATTQRCVGEPLKTRPFLGIVDTHSTYWDRFTRTREALCHRLRTPHPALSNVELTHLRLRACTCVRARARARPVLAKVLQF